MEGLDAFLIEVIPQEFNAMRVDVLVGSTSLMIPHPNFQEDLYTIELSHCPNVPNNSDSWKMFDNDTHINSFLQGVE